MTQTNLRNNEAGENLANDVFVTSSSAVEKVRVPPDHEGRLRASTMPE